MFPNAKFLCLILFPLCFVENGAKIFFVVVGNSLFEPDWVKIYSTCLTSKIAKSSINRPNLMYSTCGAAVDKTVSPREGWIDEMVQLLNVDWVWVDPLECRTECRKGLSKPSGHTGKVGGPRVVLNHSILSDSMFEMISFENRHTVNGWVVRRRIIWNKFQGDSKKS